MVILDVTHHGGGSSIDVTDSSMTNVTDALIRIVGIYEEMFPNFGSFLSFSLHILVTSMGTFDI